MATTVVLHHTTRYEFDRRIALAPHVVRLRPAPHCPVPIHRYALEVTPTEHFLNWQQDPFGNWLARLVFPEKARELTLAVEVVAELNAINPFDFFLEDVAQKTPFDYETQLQRDLTPYLEHEAAGPRLAAFLASIDRSAQPTVDFLVELNQRLRDAVGYLVRMEPGVQAPEHTLTVASGSCRDSAWLLVQVLRHLGLAARFVSGYLVQLKPDKVLEDGPPGPTADFTDLHAWAEVFLPGAGWVGLDATSGLFTGEGHIPLACTPDPFSAAAVTGAHESAEVAFSYRNDVRRIHEDPRVSLPFDDASWTRIDALGRAVDGVLTREDVRLTIGGEPTFVSRSDMEAPEWNTEALGDDKRRLAESLFGRLQTRLGEGGIAHFGQGKWYPGEPLPRWALGLYWRRDGKPLDDGRGLAKTTDPDDRVQPGHAGRLATAIAQQLGFPGDAVIAGFEDAAWLAWQEARLPANVSTADNKLEDPLERARAARLLGGDDAAPVGYALPLTRSADDPGFRTSPWRFRAGTMYLVPGDSPMGLRLPLAALPWAREPEPPEPERDPFAGPAAVLAPPVEVATEQPNAASRPVPVAMVEDDDEALVRTALCTEYRAGGLYVFMPPLVEPAHYFELVQLISAAAASLGIRVLLEGYPPPSDAGLEHLSVTPDPGVIEVNVQPQSGWDGLVAATEALYADAERNGLGAEKFMLDGRHTGTGGGNHVTLGGATPSESPFLRKPSLLGSLVGYWQQHPALSYLFSGLFIGPTSQAPRVDEARDDNLYELGIALAQLSDAEAERPWRVDRILRNFLTDLTGNTHRAEICIDKLYAPAGPAGRKGLVELRAFEMPPHPRMSLVQALLVRALVARFWSRPWQGELVRWGTQLHDRFMLRHFVAADLDDVLADLRVAGFSFERAWFEPFLEFRFPLAGKLQAGDMTLTLHNALEPWHVLGEESTGQGTARYVDSTVERLEVTLSGATDRYVVACNGRRVPLKETGSALERVGAVRFKAWQEPSSLHPLIDTHVPLTFDILDTHTLEPVASCIYHISHPGGRTYETFPVNAEEAEARRNARFWKLGQVRAYDRVPPSEVHPDCPLTLDLRRAPPPG